MPNKRTPEQRRAYRERCIAEGRCANCGRDRGPRDTETLVCQRCRETKNRGSARRYADKRAENPPDFDKGDPRESFRYGAVRLDNTRLLNIDLDRTLVETLNVIRGGFIQSGLYEAHSRSILYRGLLKLPNRLGVEERVRPRWPVRREDWMGYQLHFKIDSEIEGILARYRARTGRRQADAVRDILFWSAEHLVATYNNWLREGDAPAFTPNEFYEAVARRKSRPSERTRHHTPTPRAFPGIFRRPGSKALPPV